MAIKLIPVAALTLRYSLFALILITLFVHHKIYRRHERINTRLSWLFVLLEGLMVGAGRRSFGEKFKGNFTSELMTILAILLTTLPIFSPKIVLREF
jgi:Mn2+/Fe2+ NRAMP family transporter